MTEQRRTTDHLSRRTALTGVATVGVGVPFLVACGADEETASDPSSATGSSPSADSSGSPTPSDTGSSAAAGGLASTSDIEVGGGEIFADEEVVVVQPTAGEFKAYSAVCTHQGCLVASISSEGIVCPCHNSVFSLDDGAPTSGPASEPLEEVQLTVTGDQISLA